MRVQTTFHGVSPAELPAVVDVLSASVNPVTVKSRGDYTFEVTTAWSEAELHRDDRKPFLGEELMFGELNRRIAQATKNNEERG